MNLNNAMNPGGIGLNPGNANIGMNISTNGLGVTTPNVVMNPMNAAGNVNLSMGGAANMSVDSLANGTYNCELGHIGMNTNNLHFTPKVGPNGVLQSNQECCCELM